MVHLTNGKSRMNQNCFDLGLFGGDIVDYPFERAERAIFAWPAVAGTTIGHLLEEESSDILLR